MKTLIKYELKIMLAIGAVICFAHGLLLSDGGDHLPHYGIRFRGVGGYRTGKRGGRR